MNPLYETDFHAWAHQQAAMLRAGRLTEADIDNIAEEIESMGRTEKRELFSRLRVLLMHLLKWEFQKKSRGHSWHYTILEQRDALQRHLLENPSLKPQIAETLPEAYRSARLGAAKETGMAASDFPPACPWTHEQAIDDAFWPGGNESAPC